MTEAENRIYNRIFQPIAKEPVEINLDTLYMQAKKGIPLTRNEYRKYIKLIQDKVANKTLILKDGTTELDEAGARYNLQLFMNGCGGWEVTVSEAIGLNGDTATNHCLTEKSTYEAQPDGSLFAEADLNYHGLKIECKVYANLTNAKALLPKSCHNIPTCLCYIIDEHTWYWGIRRNNKFGFYKYQTYHNEGGRLVDTETDICLPPPDYYAIYIMDEMLHNSPDVANFKCYNIVPMAGGATFRENNGQKISKAS